MFRTYHKNHLKLLLLTQPLKNFTKRPFCKSISTVTQFSKLKQIQHKIVILLSEISRQKNLHLTPSDKESLESISNLGWSDITPYPNLTTPAFSQYIHTSYLRQPNPSYSKFTEKFYLEKTLGDTKIQIIFQAIEINKKIIDHINSVNNSITEDIKESFKYIEKRHEEKFNKGALQFTKLDFMVTIRNINEPGGVLYECTSMSGHITVNHVMNTKTDDELEELVWMDETNKERLRSRGPEVWLTDDVNQFAIIDYLWVHGVDNKIARAVEFLGVDLWRQANLQFYDGLNKFVMVQPVEEEYPISE